MKLEVTDNNILFVFASETAAGGFVGRTQWGFELREKVDDGKRPKWGQVIATGPNVKDVVKGDFILIESLRWTNAITFDGNKFWATNEKEVMVISKERPQE